MDRLVFDLCFHFSKEKKREKNICKEDWLTSPLNILDPVELATDSRSSRMKAQVAMVWLPPPIIVTVNNFIEETRGSESWT